MTSPPTPEQRRQSALHFDRAGQLVATGAHRDGVRLLVECCRLDPGNLLYRQALRRAAKARFGHRPPRAWLAWLRTWATRARLQAARAGGRYFEVLHQGERVLEYNPWDVATHRSMSLAAERLGLHDVAVWLLEQARHAAPNDADLNRQLARRYESRGSFTQALALWALVRDAAPADEEAASRLAEVAGGPAVTFEQVAAAKSRRDADPTQASGYLELGRLLRDGGRFDEARAAFAEGLAPTGHAFELTAELAELDIEPFRLDLAATMRRLAGRPGDEDLSRIADELRREVNTRELELYRLLADRHPGRLVYRYEVGLRLLRAGQLSEAMEELKAVRADASLEGPALLALAHGFRSRQHPRQALKHFEEALACLPAEPAGRRNEVMYELAVCHAEVGELPRAVTLGTELANADPGHRDIGRLLAEWRSRAGQAQAS